MSECKQIFQIKEQKIFVLISLDKNHRKNYQMA